MVPITKLLNSLKDLLPRIAEEGNYVSVVSIESLCDSLAGETKLSADYIQGVLDMLEQHWLGLGLLDRDQCKQGNWRFSSFSASLQPGPCWMFCHGIDLSFNQEISG